MKKRRSLPLLALCCGSIQYQFTPPTPSPPSLTSSFYIPIDLDLPPWYSFLPGFHEYYDTIIVNTTITTTTMISDCFVLSNKLLCFENLLDFLLGGAPPPGA